MNNLYEYGEFLLCIGPIFLIIFIIFGVLLWNSLPSRTVNKKKRDEHDDQTDV